ncbi:MAG: YicC/YloC family endoribonuclease [Bacteroidota bacterium]
MIKSMTGFGSASYINKDKKISVEIKSLNSKQLDINSRVPLFMKNHEMEIRSMIAQKLERGKIDFYINMEGIEGEPVVNLNQRLLIKYCQELRKVSEIINEPVTDILGLALRMPDVFSAPEQTDEKDWIQLAEFIAEAINGLNTSREHEGKVLENDMQMRVMLITKLLEKIKPFEKKRIENIRERIKNDLKKYFDESQIDKNRFEQELFFYIEKLDITEEKVRLKKHCGFFLETLNERESNGKKLSFIIQEMGREINTLGSKANDAEIQMIIVQMKDELEKIREQLMNVL